MSKGNYQNNNDFNDGQRRNDYALTLPQLGTFLVVIGSLVSAWVSLNSSQVETDTRLAAFEKYYKESLDTYKISNEKTINDLKEIMSKQEKTNKEIIEQLTDLERSVTQIYRMTSRKNK